MPCPPLLDPEGTWTRTLARLRGATVLFLLFATIIPLNALQIACLVVRLFSPAAFKSINRWGANAWWGGCTRAAAWGYGTRIELSGDPLPLRENVMLLANHQQMADITFLMFLGLRQQRLGDMKWFVKDVLKWVPGVGWGMRYLDCFFVKRNWTEDKASIAATFAAILRYARPVWVVLFPEGTRVNPSKIARGQHRALAKGRFQLDHVLTPHTKGFTASIGGLRQHLNAVYDVTIGYQDGVPSLWQYIQGFGRLAHVHVRRHPIETLPLDETELTAWLQQRWHEKDARLARFYQRGAFDGVD